MASRKQTERFIAKLTGSIEEPVTVQVLPEGSSSVIPHILHGRLDQLWDELEQLNRHGAGVFVMVNAGDGKGRRAENAVAVRSLFIDLDGAPLPISFPLEPHIVVQSSPGRYHVYWCCNDLPLEDFGVLQRTLAKVYGGDPAVCDLPRAMRLPGLLHQKSTPTLVRLIEAHDHTPYAYAAILEAWPELDDALTAREQARIEAEARRQRARLNPVVVTSERVQRLLQSHHDAVADAPEGQRHSVLLRHARVLGGYVGSGTVTLEDASEALTAAAEVCGLSEAEAAGAIAWALAKGQDEPLHLSAFGSAESFKSKECDLNIFRLGAGKPCLGLSVGRFSTRPGMGGKPCL